MKTNGAEFIIQFLENAGVRTVSGIPGGAILPLYDALGKSRLRHILARHEQGAGFIAQGMARATGFPGVAFATSGPGAMNLLTAIADAKLDSIPMLAITAQVPRALIGTDAFQEVDTFSLALPITKQAFMARSARELATMLPMAWRLTTEGRPGPVLIDIPKDVFLEEVDGEAWRESAAATPRISYTSPSRAQLENAAAMIHRAKRPLIYLGGGVKHAGAEAQAAAFARKNGIPVACTLHGLDCFPAGDPLRLGMLGMHGSRATNLIVDEADLLIALGARFDDRATGELKSFAAKARIIHADIDAREIGKLRPADQALPGDLKETLEGLMPMVHEDARASWRAEVDFIRSEFPSPEDGVSGPGSPASLIAAAAAALPQDALITTDVGQHQMWVAQHYPFRAPRTFLTSGGLGTMGFGIPAAIGAALASPGRRVACFTGDGSILMNLQELAVLAEHGLDVKILLFDNGELGMVRQQQELFYGERFQASRFGRRPDFTAIARGFGIRAFDAKHGVDPRAMIGEALSQPGPALVRLPMGAQNVWPMVAPGAANTNMLVGEGRPVEGPQRADRHNRMAPAGAAAPTRAR